MITGHRFRRTLGHFCTGVTVVTALDDPDPGPATPVGFTCQAFAALSLDPPLVLFCPGRTSRTWPVIERTGRFCVNVLSEAQRGLSTAFGRPGTDKFTATQWFPAPSGAPVLAGVLTWIDCSVETAHDAGDHFVVIGRVTAMGEPDAARPLLFYRGGYAQAEPARGILDELVTWSGPDDWI
jgi:3-hydroxy-9,10-secoandrosta-1,3,5(10)-triene-9,17-dione monooxygenase reductase component